MLLHLHSKPSVVDDNSSFESIFARYYTLVYQLAYRCTGKQDEADDIAQEVFLRFYRTPPAYRSEGERRAWLCRVATNLSLNALRSQQRRTQNEEKAGQTSFSGQENDPEQQALIGEQIGLIREVIARMPERQQTYLLLRSVGLTYAEIAAATGVAPASVGSLLARAEKEFWRKYNERAREQF